MTTPAPTTPDYPLPMQAIAKRLNTCWTRYLTELKRTRKEFAQEYIHDLRVAIRRLISVIDMGRAITEQEKLKKAKKILKEHLDTFDQLRDIQVQLVILEELEPDLPEVTHYREYLRQRERQQIVRLEKRIKEFRINKLTQQIAALEQALLAKDTTQDQEIIWSVIDTAFARTKYKQKAINAEDVNTIHRVRLGFKKFRYRVESIYESLENTPKDFLKNLHDYQAAMGEIQDAEIGLEMLNDFATRSGIEMSETRTRFEEMRQTRINHFLEQAPQLETFWRAAPNQPFPWEETPQTE